MALYRHVAKGRPGEVWTFTLHTTGLGDLTSAQTAWESATGALWTGQLDALMCTDVAMTEVSTASLDEATGRQISRVATGVTRPGTAVGACLPFQCAPVVSLRTDLATRSGRGRFYLPALAEGNTTAGRLLLASQQAIVTAAQQFFASLDTGGLQPILLSRVSLAQTPVTSFDVGDVIDTQRRRRNQLVEQRITGSVV